MTDRYSGFFVALDGNMHSDDAEATIAAIKQIRGVFTVVPNAAGVDELLARQKAAHELRQKLWDVLK